MKILISIVLLIIFAIFSIIHYANNNKDIKITKETNYLKENKTIDIQPLKVIDMDILDAEIVENDKPVNDVVSFELENSNPPLSIDQWIIESKGIPDLIVPVNIEGIKHLSVGDKIRFPAINGKEENVAITEMPKNIYHGDYALEGDKFFLAFDLEKNRYLSGSGELETTNGTYEIMLHQNFALFYSHMCLYGNCQIDNGSIDADLPINEEIISNAEINFHPVLNLDKSGD